jgi:hypothetical protein
VPDGAAEVRRQPGVNLIKLFFFVTDEATKNSFNICPSQAFPSMHLNGGPLFATVLVRKKVL